MSRGTSKAFISTDPEVEIGLIQVLVTVDDMQPFLWCSGLLKAVDGYLSWHLVVEPEQQVVNAEEKQNQADGDQGITKSAHKIFPLCKGVMGE